MKNKKLFKFASAPILLAGVVCPTLVLSSCKNNNSEKHEEKQKLVKLDFSQINSPNDLQSFNRPFSIRNDSQTYFYLYYSIPESIRDTYNYEIYYRVADDYGKAPCDWIQLTNFSPKSGEILPSIKVNPKEIFQIVITTPKPEEGEADYLGYLSNAEEQVSFGLYNEDGCEWGKGATIGGSIRSLLGRRPETGYWPDHCTYSDSLTTDYCFYKLFAPTYNDGKVSTALFSNFISDVSPNFLPFTTVTKHCYDSMFKGCTSLLCPPALPATKHYENSHIVEGLADGCYEAMFCDNKLALTSSPYLPARVLATDCYKDMFKNCQNLEYASLAYVGVFDDKYFSNWMYGVERAGAMYYNGIKDNLPKGSGSVPETWDIKQDTSVISNFLKDITVTADPESSRVTSRNVIRAYKDQTFATVSEQFENVQSALYSEDEFEYWAKKEDDELVEIEDIKNTAIEDLPSAIYPRYGYHPEIDSNYTNISTLTSSKISLAKTATNAKVQYKTDAGDWTDLSSTEVTFPARTHIVLRGNVKSTSATNYTNIKITGKVQLGGTVMSLVQTTDDVNPTDIPNAFCFYKLFYGSTGISTVDSTFLYTSNGTTYTAIKDLSTSNRQVCYGSMFEGCTYLTQAPEVPATTLGHGNYYCMFKNCDRLQKFGEIPATSCGTATNPDGNYYGTFESMFEDCNLLEEVAPTNGLLVEYGQLGMYHRMFYNCTALKKAPNMSKLKDLSTNGLSGKKTSITTDDEGNYGICTCMFQACTAMTEAPENWRMTTTDANTKIGTYACQCMFYGSGIKKTPAWSFATNDSYHEKCFRAMFKNCPNLTECVSDLGTYNVSISSYGKYCFCDMFNNCTSLVKPPQLPYLPDPAPGTTSWPSNYNCHYMFYNCTSMIYGAFRDSSDPTKSGYTFHRFFKAVKYKNDSAMRAWASHMLYNGKGSDVNVEKDNNATWSSESGTPDNSWSGNYIYGYFTKNE